MAACRSEIAQISRKRLAQVAVAAIRRIAQQVGSFFRENLCSKPFPYFYGKFIDRRNARDERYARASACRTKIKLLSCTLVRNCFYPFRNTKWKLSCRMGFRFATANLYRRRRGEFVCAQEDVGERIRYKRSGFRL